MSAHQPTVLVTGATDGLGKALAAELAGTGATVLVHGRDQERGERTLAELREQTGTRRSAGIAPTSRPSPKCGASPSRSRPTTSGSTSS